MRCGCVVWCDCVPCCCQSGGSCAAGTRRVAQGCSRECTTTAYKLTANAAAVAATAAAALQVKSFVDLWHQLQTALPELGLGRHGSRLKVVYMDAAGDWVLALPDQRWQSFLEVAQRVLVTTGC